MRTVRDFKTYFERELGVQWESEPVPSKRREFWKKLNQLGWDKKTQEPGECDDVDATAQLTDEEWAELDAEFRTL